MKALRIVAVSFWVVSFLLPVFSVHAAEEKFNAPCRADIEKFCKDIQPGKGAIVRCLRQHRDELSPECKAKGKEIKARARNFREACEDDVEKLCGKMKPGRGSVLKCLRDKKELASEKCRNFLSQKRKR